MGYDTQFSGEFEVRPEPLDEDMVAYLQAFSRTRRQTWSAWMMDSEFYPDPLRDRVGIPLGSRGDHFVGHLDWESGRSWHDPAIRDSNTAPGDRVKSLIFYEEGGLAPCDKGFPHSEHDCVSKWMTTLLEYGNPARIQPGLNCQWIPNDDGTVIEWDQNEKFYSFDQWLAYLCHNYLTPFGRWLEGRVHWRGEDFDDVGTLVAERNTVVSGTVVRVENWCDVEAHRG